MTNGQCSAPRVLRTPRLSEPHDWWSMRGVSPGAGSAPRLGQLSRVRRCVATLAAGLRAAADSRGHRTGLWCGAAGRPPDHAQPLPGARRARFQEPRRHRPAFQSLATAAASRAGRPTRGVRSAAHRVAVPDVSQRRRTAFARLTSAPAADAGVYPIQMFGASEPVDRRCPFYVSARFQKVPLGAIVDGR